MHVVALWEEAGEPGEKPHRHQEKMHHHTQKGPKTVTEPTASQCRPLIQVNTSNVALRLSWVSWVHLNFTVVWSSFLAAVADMLNDFFTHTRTQSSTADSEAPD